MKQFFVIIIVALFLCLSTNAQTSLSAKTYIVSKIKEAQSDFPLKLDGITLDKLYIKDGFVTSEGHLNKSNQNIDTICTDFKKRMQEALYTSGLKNDKFASNLEHSGFGIKFSISSQNSDKIKTFSFSPTELYRILNGTYKFFNMLDETVKSINEQAPIKWSDLGWSVMSVYVENNYFVYSIKNDESDASNETLFSLKNQGNKLVENKFMKERLVKLAKSADEEMFPLMLVMCNLGMKYSIWTNDPKLSCDFYITPQEVVECINQANK